MVNNTKLTTEKEKYLPAELEVIRFMAEDIVTASVVTPNGAGDNTSSEEDDYYWWG